MCLDITIDQHNQNGELICAVCGKVIYGKRRLLRKHELDKDGTVRYYADWLCHPHCKIWILTNQTEWEKLRFKID